MGKNLKGQEWQVQIKRYLKEIRPEIRFKLGQRRSRREVGFRCEIRSSILLLDILLLYIHI